MTRGTTRTRFRFLGAALVAASISLFAASGATAKKFDKPAKPQNDVPAMSGLTSGTLVGADAGKTKWGTPATASAPSGNSNRDKDPAGYAQPLGSAAPGAIGAKTLVLYDTTNTFGWIGELYAMYAGNLASHFGTWKAVPVSQYQTGMIGQYTATIYIGSTYDEPLPAAFLGDVVNATKPVLWIYDNIWELTNYVGWNQFIDKYGWTWAGFDTTAISKVRYKGSLLNRDSVDNGGGIMAYANLDTTKATPLGYAVHDADGSEFPWALKSGNLYYFGENPFVYTSETDRVLAFDDILTSVLNPFATERHRVLMRLEDLSPSDDPANVKMIAQYLYDNHIPYGFGYSPVFLNPLGVDNGGVPESLKLSDNKQSRDWQALIKWMQAHGGTLIMHGYTHQWRDQPNPYNAMTGDDFEFYRTVENPDHTLTFVGPVPEDSASWAAGRITQSFREFQKAGAAAPEIFEFPHYMASAVDYKVVGALFKTRWERALYFSGLLSGGTVNYQRVIGQFFPWVVRDVYGTTVLPENIGSYEPEPFYQFPMHTVDDILNAAKAERVIRDGVAGVYYHNFWGLEPLKQIVNGLKAQGWTFADPDTVLAQG
jgi:uncharacterized protein YdaL